MIDPLDYDIVDLIKEAEANPDFKGEDDITVRVNDLLYKIPYYCLTSFLWGMPDEFYPCDKYEWADHPKYFTTIEMVRAAIEANEAKFVAFILYNKRF